MSGLEALFAAGAADATIAGAGLGTGLTVPATAIGTEYALGSTLAPQLSAPVSTGLKVLGSTAPEFTAPMFASTISPAAQAAGITLGSGLIPAAGATLGTAAASMAPLTALRGATTAMQALSPTGGTASAYSPPAMKQGRQVNLSEPILSLLASAQPQRRKQPLSLL